MEDRKRLSLEVMDGDGGEDMELAEPNCHRRRCKHYLGVGFPEGEDEERHERQTCRAFPQGIPDPIAYGGELHLEPWPGQGNDIVYERG